MGRCYYIPYIAPFYSVLLICVPIIDHSIYPSVCGLGMNTDTVLIGVLLIVVAGLLYVAYDYSETIYAYEVHQAIQTDKMRELITRNNYLERQIDEFPDVCYTWP